LSDDGIAAMIASKQTRCVLAPPASLLGLCGCYAVPPWGRPLLSLLNLS
jgi:hypothetical protein